MFRHCPFADFTKIVLDWGHMFGTSCVMTDVSAPLSHIPHIPLWWDIFRHISAKSNCGVPPQGFIVNIVFANKISNLGEETSQQCLF